MRRVITSGLGVVSPVGVGKDTFWQSLLNGVLWVITLDRVTCCNLSGQHECGVQVVREAAGFDPGTHRLPPTYYTIDRFIQLAFAAHQAFHNAHVDKGAWDNAMHPYRIQRAASAHVIMKEGAL